VDETDILSIRLHNQHLSNPNFKKVTDVIEHLGAVQAQEYHHTLWALGMRMQNATEEKIEKEVNKKSVVRTWPMRGTIHYVMPKNVRWMLKYLESRVKSKMQSYFRKAELTDAIFLKARKVLEKNLEGGKSMTRDEIYKKLNEASIDTKNMRGLHIIGQSASDGVICCGSRRGKQQTFVLLEEWVRKYPDLEKDEALEKLGLLYFKSHGPAKDIDLAWWAGITLTDARKAIELNKNLEELKVNDKKYFWFPSKDKISDYSDAYILAPYDEYTVAYRDRSELMAGDKNILFSGSGFWNSMIYKGKVLGMWRRVLGKDEVEIQTSPIIKFSKKENNNFEKAADRYGKFLGKKVKMSEWK
jgi:hypothetical protein